MKQLFLSLICLPVFCFSQNSVIIYRTNNMLTVGIGSYRKAPTNKEIRYTKNSTDTVQNIIHEGNFYFATTGMVSKKTIQAAREVVGKEKRFQLYLPVLKRKERSRLRMRCSMSKLIKPITTQKQLQTGMSFQMHFSESKMTRPKR